MAFKNLREFLDLLEERDELRRIRVEVDPHLEITEIADRVMKAGGPALLFENVRGSDIPLAINLLGSQQRMTWALGMTEWSELERRLDDLLSMAMGPPPKSLLGKLQTLNEIIKVGRIGPREISNAPVHEVFDTVNPSLADLPIPTCWPLDGGPYITFPLVLTHDPLTGKRNVGLYRLQKFDDRTLGMHWQRHKGGAEHWRRSKEERRRMEVAVAIGVDPTLMYSASAPLPPDVDEMVFAGFLRGAPVETVQAKTVNIQVPAHAEIVLEGWVDPSESRLEGPFGDHIGYYSLAEPFPVFHLTAVTRRRDPVFVSTIVGVPPMEDAWIGKATERLFLPLVRLFVPEMVDMNLPVHGVFPQLLHRVDSEAVSGSGPQGDAWHLGRGSADVHQVRDRGGSRRGRAEPEGSDVAGGGEHGSGAGPGAGARADGPPGVRHDHGTLRREAGHRRDAQAAPGGISAGMAAGDQDGRNDHEAGG